MLQLRSIDKFFGEFQALKNVNLSVKKGECLAIVGESGAGKTTLGNLILGIDTPSAGEIIFCGNPLPHKRTLELKKRIQVVQQNPLSALNPKRTVFQNIALPLQVHTRLSLAEQKELVLEKLRLMKLPDNFINRYPTSLSGGQRQRVAIARTLTCQPDIIVLDEPTSALDVLVQMDVLKLLQSIQKKMQLTYIFITHDLGVVRNMADNMAVFKRGEMLESGTVEQIFTKGPQHKYTSSLLSAIPTLNDEEETFKQSLLHKKSHLDI